MVHRAGACGDQKTRSEPPTVPKRSGSCSRLDWRTKPRGFPPQFTKTVYNHPLLEQFFRLSMGVLLKIEGKCSCVRAKAAHFVGHLPQEEWLILTLSEPACYHVHHRENGRGLVCALYHEQPCALSAGTDQTRRLAQDHALAELVHRHVLQPSPPPQRALLGAALLPVRVFPSPTGSVP